MDVIVSRSGGLAGLRLTWEVRVDERPDADDWYVLIEEIPWSQPPPVPPSPTATSTGSAARRTRRRSPSASSPARGAGSSTACRRPPSPRRAAGTGGASPRATVDSAVAAADSERGALTPRRSLHVAHDAEGDEPLRRE